MHQHIKYLRHLGHHMTRVGGHGRTCKGQRFSHTAVVRSRIFTSFFVGQERQAHLSDPAASQIRANGDFHRWAPYNFQLETDNFQWLSQTRSAACGGTLLILRARALN
jgi:hypothetical protein